MIDVSTKDQSNVPFNHIFNAPLNKVAMKNKTKNTPLYIF